MMEFRKCLVFISVSILLIYTIKSSHFTKKKWQDKDYNYTFIILNSGLTVILAASFLDMIAALIQRSFVYALIKLFFTIGAMTYVTGIILWNNLTLSIMNKLETLAVTDSMTKVLNRNGLEKSFSTAIRTKKTFYLIVCDLNGTKKINDTLGHVYGDMYISITAKIICSAVGNMGVTARIGGDEFAVILNNMEEMRLKSILSEIKRQVTEINPDKNAGISIGYSLFPSEGETLLELIKLADKKMYDDKKSIS